IFFTESEPSLYVYRVVAGQHSQTGIVACCSLDEYEAGKIKKHEKTRPDKVKDRTDHLLAVRAQTGLILLAFRGTQNIRELTGNAVTKEPIYDFCCEGGVQHTFWKIDSSGEWVEAFDEVPSLYIADGHHRVESADLARRELQSQNPNHTGEEEYNYVLAGIFPAEELRILAYNRAVSDLNGISDEEFLQRLNESFTVTETDRTRPERSGDICMYLSGKWYNLRFAVSYDHEPDAIERLDVSTLQNYVLRPILGIIDERTDERILFVGGSLGPEKLQQAVDEGHVRIAFSLYPTSMEDLLEVSDRSEIMPPKSTWFDPKLKDGILIHLI
ncbi:MAG TPA: DUF1015 family protein, partial [Pyrinomonadaceae bacterium]|nr:DUF1015 family protein [Pyrinomonadaceae bacterium]